GDILGYLEVPSRALSFFAGDLPLDGLLAALEQFTLERLAKDLFHPGPDRLRVRSGRVDLHDRLSSFVVLDGDTHDAARLFGLGLPPLGVVEGDAILRVACGILGRGDCGHDETTQDHGKKDPFHRNLPRSERPSPPSRHSDAAELLIMLTAPAACHRAGAL